VRLLLDTCVSGVARNFLKSAGHDVVWSAEWDSDPGDDQILLRAHREERILVTIDKDFGELAIVRELRHAGIVRFVGLRSGSRVRSAQKFSRGTAPNSRKARSSQQGCLE